MVIATFEHQYSQFHQKTDDRKVSSPWGPTRGDICNRINAKVSVIKYGPLSALSLLYLLHDNVHDSALGTFYQQERIDPLKDFIQNFIPPEP